MRVVSYSGETAHIAALRELYVSEETSPRTVEEVREVAGAALLKLRGVDSREAAERLRGAVLWVDRGRASPRGANEFYVGDLCGCEVRRGDEVLGTVASVVEGGASSLLEVKSAKGGSFLVPFVEAWVGDVSVERRTVELRADFEEP